MLFVLVLLVLLFLLLILLILLVLLLIVFRFLHEWSPPKISGEEISKSLDTSMAFWSDNIHGMPEMDLFFKIDIFNIFVVFWNFKSYENNSDYLQKARKYGHFTGYKN